MKNKTLLLLFLSPVFTCAQSASDDEKYFHYNYATPGMHLLNDAINIKYSSRKDNNPNRRYANAVKSGIEKDLLNAARYQVRQHLKQQRINSLNQQRAFAKEAMLASAWTSSRTGIVSGASWHSLSWQEQQMYRERYVSHFHKSNSAAVEKAPIHPFLEEEISAAWADSETGKNDGRAWSDLSDLEREYHRSTYHSRKQNMPLGKRQTISSEIKYKEAWLSLKNDGYVDKYWHELDSFEKSMFRRKHKMTEKYDDGLLALR